MNFRQYQEAAKKTAIYPDYAKYNYPILGLVNEAGEVAGKWKKFLRDEEPNEETWDALTKAIKAELGDVLWYLSAVASDFDITLEDIAQANVEKLASRQQRGVLGGSGDDR